MSDPQVRDFNWFQHVRLILLELYPDVVPEAPGVPISMVRCARAVADGLMTIDEGRDFRDHLYEGSPT